MTRRYLKSGKLSESIIQKTIVREVKKIPLIKECLMHLPNEGKRTNKYGHHLKQMGMMPGASDIFIALARHGYHGAWIEIKSEDGKLTKAQDKFLKIMNKNGFYTHICRSIKDGIDIITWYCLEV